MSPENGSHHPESGVAILPPLTLLLMGACLCARHWMELSLRHQRACGHKGTIEIFDAGGMSYSQLYMPGIRLLARTLKIGQSHYVESMHRCIVFNAPKFFSIIWKVLSVVLNERARAKTTICSDDGQKLLQELTGLEPAHVTRLVESAVDSPDPEGFDWLTQEESPVVTDALDDLEDDWRIVKAEDEGGIEDLLAPISSVT